MATTESFATAITSNSINANKWFADDGLKNSPIYNAAVGDLTLSGFSSLSIPDGATINGIRIDIEGAGNPASANIPHMKVYNSQSWSSGKAFSNGTGGQFSKAGGTFSPGWGADDDLWGLSWTVSEALEINIKIDSSSMDSGGYFWDWIKLFITYTEAPTTYEPGEGLELKMGVFEFKNGTTEIK